MPILDIFIVTYSKDYPYLRWCLKSIAKFARGFNNLHILVPVGDAADLHAMPELQDVKSYAMPVHIHEGEEWPGKGFVWHMFQVMYADNWCMDADFIAHIDPDCIFTEAVTPDDYVKDGKPILRYEYYATLGIRHPGAAVWQGVVQDCLPFPVDKELMRCHPGVHHRWIYEKTRQIVETHKRIPFEDYMHAGKNEFPHDRCEYNTLGSVAAQYFAKDYILVEQKGDRVTPDNKLQQFWGRGRIDLPQRVWVQGGERDVVPLNMCHMILGE